LFEHSQVKTDKIMLL